MTNLDFEQLDLFFRNDDFPSLEIDTRGIRFLKLRSMSRRDTLEEFANTINVILEGINSRNYFQFIFDNENVTEEQIDLFINHKYNQERELRLQNEDYLVDQLCRLQHFDWGGSFGNSLEKNIVDNYVKKIQSYEGINEEIEGNLLSSLRGYTLNSWYNHWTSILIEDLFKDHTNVLPTIGLVKKIDFFIQNIPFDLKVTYFPEELMKQKLKDCGFGNELTKLKQICRRLNIYIPNDLPEKSLKLHLFNRVAEDQRLEAREFIQSLREIKREIIYEAEQNPTELKIWLYENQGEARFDASNRFFLVLTDENDTSNSWKLKRNIVFLREKITEHLDNVVLDIDRLNTRFYWKKTQRYYNCKSDILFVKQ